MTSRKSAVLESPQTTIGAQDLLNIGKCSKSGFLRKQGTLERLFKFLKWRQKFVVLSRGCIYVFKDELATRPQASFTLKLFLRTSRNDDNGRVRSSFKLLPVDQQRGKTLFFACISELERKEWMKFVKAEMVKAHDVKDLSKDESTDEYVYLEKPVLEDKAVKHTKPGAKVALDEEEIDIDADDPGGEKDYTTIDDAMLDDRPPMPEPGTKKAANKKKAMKPTFKPALPNENTEIKPTFQQKARSLPASMNPNAVLRTAFEYKGSDRIEIESLLVQRPEGTYLVRKSRSDGKEVLSVNIDGCLKEFKIYTKDSTVTINNSDYFQSVEELIQYYIDNPLPKKAAKLYRAYSVLDPRYINN